MSTPKLLTTITVNVQEEKSDSQSTFIYRLPRSKRYSTLAHQGPPGGLGGQF